MNATFRRYRVMSFVTGTTLLILYVTQFINVVDLTLWKHMYWFVKIVGIGHGVVLYPIYMIMCFNLVMKFRLNVFYLGLMLFAGFVPGLAFFIEHFMRLKLYPQGLAAK